MAGIAIVAIPEQDDPVWKVSSEKVPHLTLLYLEGPLGNEENTIRFIQHAAKTLHRFGLSVDRRGILGADNADVVFLDKRYGGKELLDFRYHLLTNKDISEAYHKAEQYPMWTPHVTLGFPTSPANKTDTKLHWVNFDRIAVWTGDYVGPEFMLDEDRGMEIDIPAEWSDDFSDFLEHFGVRGMKWGVRRAADSSGRVGGTIGVANLRGNQGFLTTAPGAPKPSNKTMVATKEATDNVRRAFYQAKDSPFRPNGEMDKINAKYVDGGASSPARAKKYDAEMSTAFTSYAKKQAPEGMTARVEIRGPQALLVVGDKATVDKFIKDVAHAEDYEVVRIPLIRDENGLIIGLGKDDELEQALVFDTFDDFLEHFGVRGMKWGVRRAVGPDGRVLGKPPGLAKKSGGKSDTDDGAQLKIKKGRGSADHQRLVKNLDKKVENLSTADIRAITARIQAINQLKAETAKERAAKASMSKKIVKWALNQVVEGAVDRTGKIIKEHAGDIVQEIIPKSKTQQGKDEETRQKNIKFEQSQEDRAAKKARESGSTQTKDRDTAVKDLADAVLKSDGAYEITTKKKGG